MKCPKKIKLLFFALVSFLSLGLSFALSSAVSATDTHISNPTVIYSRWYTTQSTSPQISSNTGEPKQIPFRIISGGDTFLVGSDNWFSVDMQFLELTTYEGEFAYWYSSISGGDISNCSVTIRSTTGAAYNPDCKIKSNQLTQDGGPVVYGFSGSIPTNEGVARVDFRVGYVDCTSVYQCIPLSAGPISITDFWMDITTTSSSSTVTIVNSINSVNQNISVLNGKIDDLNDGIDTLNSSIEDLRSDTQAQTEAIEQGNDDAQARWEQDREDLQNTADDISSSTQEQGSLIGIPSVNPFSALWDLFNPPISCVNIPIIAGLLHSNSTVYCSWFSSSVREVVTPVVGISSMMLLFGLFVRWVQGKENITL